jgi:D-tyrosyl-tRNA(Tyr) deacylase
LRVLLQRVSQASVQVEGKITGQIGRGTLVLAGVAKADSHSDADYLAEKIVNLRIFPDDGGKMNRSLRDIGGAALVVSQFTLYGDCSKGRRPGFDMAAPPELANDVYEYLVTRLRAAGIHVETGVFQASMQVSLINDGPVTFVLDSRTVGNKLMAKSL